MFPLKSHEELIDYVESFDWIKYWKTRNYINGWVSKLSPYITHGVITTKEIVESCLKRYKIEEVEMRIKELLRREYFVQVHYWQQDWIFSDMENDKTGIYKKVILPKSVITKTTPSKRVNEAMLTLEQTGYLHNHVRMWLASYWTHYGLIYRRKLADWTYYHFIDGELWSNYLSRQWVQSTFSHKPYFMNEENLSRYRPGSSDPTYRGTYEEVEKRLFDPERESIYWTDEDVRSTLKSDLSMFAHRDKTSILQGETTTILTPWDRHPDKCNDPQNSICILDERFFEDHPWSTKRIDFIQQYASHYNIKIYRWLIWDILKEAKDKNTKIRIFETRNPRYRTAYENHANANITLIPHQWTSPIVKKSYTKKFFWFWGKTLPHLYELQRYIWKDIPPPNN